MIMYSIAVLADAAVDNGVYALMGFLVVASLITWAICAVTPQKKWPHNTPVEEYQRDGHGWVKEDGEKW
jgi:hypothetical protein